MFGQMTKNLSVSTGLPGPTISFQLPSAVEPSGSIICGPLVLPWVTSTTLSRPGRELAQRSISDCHVRHGDAALQTEIPDDKGLDADGDLRGGVLDCGHDRSRGGLARLRRHAANGPDLIFNRPLAMGCRCRRRHDLACEKIAASAGCILRAFAQAFRTDWSGIRKESLKNYSYLGAIFAASC